MLACGGESVRRGNTEQATGGDAAAAGKGGDAAAASKGGDAAAAASKGGDAAAASKGGDAAATSKGGAAVAEAGGACATHDLSELCARWACPDSPEHVVPDCVGGLHPGAKRYPSSCGGYTFVQNRGFGQIFWHFDAKGQLIGARDATSDTAPACGDGAFYQYGRQCTRTGPEEDLCAAGGGSGFGGDGGASSLGETGGAGGAQ